jgi:CelD/BcsL family acetyltransferase involved in cellulose biosynthesis
MKIKVVDKEKDFDNLEATWERLAEKVSASYFSSFYFVRALWQHFHEPGHRLVVLVATDGATPVGIAPFLVARTKQRGIPCRTVRFINNMWVGDRPEILADGDGREIWREIITFLFRELSSWDLLELGEQPVEGPLEKGWDFLSRPGLYWDRVDDAVGYYVPLNGTFEDYLKLLSARTRRDWRSKSRHLKGSIGDFDIECVSEPEQMMNALKRFIAVEQLGWKAASGAALSRDATRIGFYEDIIGRLAQTREVGFYFLSANGADIASTIAFLHRDVAYLKEITYDPAHSKCSPGIVLLAGVIERMFGSPYKELDLMGMREDKGPQRYKRQWAKGRRETVLWRGYRTRGRLLPLLAAKRVKRLFTGQPAELTGAVR